MVAGAACGVGIEERQVWLGDRAGIEDLQHQAWLADRRTDALIRVFDERCAAMAAIVTCLIEEMSGEQTACQAGAVAAINSLLRTPIGSDLDTDPEFVMARQLAAASQA